MKSYDETPWWCQLLWPWFGPPWYAQIEDPDAWLDAIRRQFARQAGELADDLTGDDSPGEGYLAKARRLTAARLQAEEIIRREHGPVGSQRQLNGSPVQPSGGLHCVGQQLRHHDLGGISQVGQPPFPQQRPGPGPAAARRGKKRSKVERRMQWPSRRRGRQLIRS